MSQFENSEEQRARTIDVLVQVRDYLAKLADGCARIRGKYQEGEIAEGQALLAEFLDGVNWVTQAVAVSSPVRREFGIDMDLDQLNETLQPTVDALENQDYGLIGDVLEYEIQPILESWARQLGKIAA